MELLTKHWRGHQLMERRSSWALVGLFLVAALLGVLVSDEKFRSYAVILVAGASVLGVLALVWTLSYRKQPGTLQLVADERQSWWEQWTYPDGRVTTSLCLHWEATNLTNTPIRF